MYKWPALLSLDTFPGTYIYHSAVVGRTQTVYSSVKSSKYRWLGTGIVLLQSCLLFCRLSCPCLFSLSLHTWFLGFQAFPLLRAKQSPLGHFFLAVSCSENCVICGLTGVLQSAAHIAFRSLHCPESNGDLWFFLASAGMRGLVNSKPCVRNGSAKSARRIWINRSKTER